MSETIRSELIGPRLRAIPTHLNAQQIEIDLARKEFARTSPGNNELARFACEMLNEVVQAQQVSLAAAPVQATSVIERWPANEGR
jgi:hypothetical protein